MITPYEPWHLGAARFKPEPAADIAAGDPRQLVELSKRGLCKTIFGTDFSTVLGIMGAVPSARLPGIVEVFILATEDQARCAATFAKSVRAELNILRQHFANIDTIGEDTPEILRWFSWLGFTYIGQVDRPEFGDKKMLLWSMSGGKS
jgi:hypothetical protein